MNLEFLEAVHEFHWKEICVIGKTIEKNEKKYHIIGMTLSDCARLYVLEFQKNFHSVHRRSGIKNQRRELKESFEQERYNKSYFFGCEEITFGGVKFSFQGATSSYLEYIMENPEMIKFFLQMLEAGWKIPDWIKNEKEENIQFTVCEFDLVKHLPVYTSNLPITVKHYFSSNDYLLEKKITLTVGKKKNFSFEDFHEEKVECFINDVILVDVWKEMEDYFENELPALLKKSKKSENYFSEYEDDKYYRQDDELQDVDEIRKNLTAALKQDCPKGMYYILVKYECSKDYDLHFYTKEYLNSLPKEKERSTSTIFFEKKSEKIGIHNLPLKSYLLQNPVAFDTSKIPMELFYYSEKVTEWKEII